MKKNRKKKYIRPTIEIIKFEKDHIIATSGGEFGNRNTFGGEGGYIDGNAYRF